MYLAALVQFNFSDLKQVASKTYTPHPQPLPLSFKRTLGLRKPGERGWAQDYTKTCTVIKPINVKYINNYTYWVIIEAHFKFSK